MHFKNMHFKNRLTLRTCIFYLPILRNLTSIFICDQKWFKGKTGYGIVQILFLRFQRALIPKQEASRPDSSAV